MCGSLFEKIDVNHVCLCGPRNEDPSLSSLVPDVPAEVGGKGDGRSEHFSLLLGILKMMVRTLPGGFFPGPEEKPSPAPRSEHLAVSTTPTQFLALPALTAHTQGLSQPGTSIWDKAPRNET